MKEKFEKYDVRNTWASRMAEQNQAIIDDITARVKETKGLKKIMVELSLTDPEDPTWSYMSRYWAQCLPTDEDLEALKGAKIVDLRLQSGWNNDKQEWGKIKVTKFILDGGQELILQGAKDEPELSESSDDE